MLGLCECLYNWQRLCWAGLKWSFGLKLSFWLSVDLFCCEVVPCVIWAYLLCSFYIIRRNNDVIKPQFVAVLIVGS
jgi:hypothetical protein